MKKLTQQEIKKSNAKSYGGIHCWILKNYGNAQYCSIDRTHTGKRFEWANIDGIYKPDIKHFKPLCGSCHRKRDITEDGRRRISQANQGAPNVFRYPKEIHASGAYRAYRLAYQRWYNKNIRPIRRAMA